MEQPILTDGRIILRPYTAEDVEPFYEAARESIAETYPWLPWCHPDYAIEETRAWMAMREQVRTDLYEHSYIIVDAAGRVLGGTGLNNVDRTNRIANLGYWIRTSEHGRGIATAATKLVARFGLEVLEMNRIEVLAAVDNHASLRVAEKAGARREGILRRRLFLHGIAHDAVMHSFVRGDEVEENRE